MAQQHMKSGGLTPDGKSVLPAGVRIRRLEVHQDQRGLLSEIFRQDWDTGVAPVQWNTVTSDAGVLRGVHVHLRHADYLVVLQGQMSLGLKDLRDDSPTAGPGLVVELDGNDLHSIFIPPGVAHGFYFHSRCLHVYAVTEYWDPDDELGCHWDDPELQIPWHIAEPVLSDRDSSLPSLKCLMHELGRRRQTGLP